MSLQANGLKQYLAYSIGGCYVVFQIFSALKKPAKREQRKDTERGGKGWQGLRELLLIAFRPHSAKRPTVLLLLYILMLLLRTLLSIAIATIDADIFKALVTRNASLLQGSVLKWFAFSVPSSAVNSGIRYFNFRLALEIRKNLSESIRGMFLTPPNCYKIAQAPDLPSTPDQLLTDDCAMWAQRLSNMINSVGKPVFDLVFFSTLLFRKYGFYNQLFAVVTIWESGKLLKFVRPNFTKNIEDRTRLEGHHRLLLSRVVACSEEIAFCGGEGREKSILQENFSKLYNFIVVDLRAQFRYYCAEECLTKYVWTAIGTAQIAKVVFSSSAGVGEIAREITILRRLMIRNGDATERIIRNIKAIEEFRGITSKIFDFLQRVEQLPPIQGSSTESNDIISVDNVAIRTPTGESLVRRMSFMVSMGDRVLILGPNGCGKSSLFRIIRGLWSHDQEGTITVPGRDRLYFLPQRPYMAEGSLRDQITYPKVATIDEDDNLTNILNIVELGDVCSRYGGLWATADWSQCLSGGEKQRLGLARIFYHKPSFAILDECTSAVNCEAESRIFEKICALGIGLLTISHRPSLYTFHTKKLAFDGAGDWSYEPLVCGDLQSLEARKQDIKNNLNQVLRQLGEPEMS